MADPEPYDATVAAYDRDAERYLASSSAPTPDLQETVERFVAGAGSAGRVLEIGSGSGRDALLLERAGMHVDRTDITAGFVRLLRAAGHPAYQLDPLTGEFPGSGYDGVWAQASLLHVRRSDLGRVLTRLLGACRPGGLLYATVKQGEGEGWSTHGSIRQARHFTYWQPEDWRTTLSEAGWQVDSLQIRERHETWLETLAHRPR